MFAESKIKHNLKLIKQSTLDMHRHVDTSRTLIRNGLRIYRKGFQFVHLCQTRFSPWGQMKAEDPGEGEKSSVCVWVWRGRERVGCVCECERVCVSVFSTVRENAIE